MPVIKSAKKRVRVARKATVRNAKTRRSLRLALKNLSKALAEGKKIEIEKAEKVAVKAIDTAAKKNVIHKNKAARKKSQVAAKVKNAGVKPAKAEKTAKPKVKATKASTKTAAKAKPKAKTVRKTTPKK